MVACWLVVCLLIAVTSWWVLLCGVVTCAVWVVGFDFTVLDCLVWGVGCSYYCVCWLVVLRTVYFCCFYWFE